MFLWYNIGDIDKFHLKGTVAMENNIGKRIAVLRKKKGLSQAELAEMLNVSDKTVSKWENGGMPGIDLLPRLAKTFNVTIDYLMLGDMETQANEAEISEQEQDMDDSEKESYVKTKEDFDLLGMDDIYVILSDQQDLYSEEELQYLQARFDELCAEKQVEPIISPKSMQRKKGVPENPPEIVTCPECGAETSGSNPSCDFCGYEFFDNKPKSENGLGCVAYIVAALFPIIGLIWGLVKSDRGVVVFSIVMFILNCILSVVLYSAYLEALFQPFM